jgi:hypothetical protein
MPVSEVNVSGWEAVDSEPMGEPGKVWLLEPRTSTKWLFKPIRMQNDPGGAFPQGDDWAEKIAADLAAVIGLPAARVELARREDVAGAVSRHVAPGFDLRLGNELIAAYDPDYPWQKTGTVEQYTLERIFRVLSDANIQGASVAPDAGEHSALSVFAGFLVLDAWVANQDRHHGNWGVVEDLVAGSPTRLGASFDHGSSLGFQLRDDFKADLLARDAVEAWAKRGVCRPMRGRPNLVDLAIEGVGIAGGPAMHWIERLDGVTATEETSIVMAVPDGRMSQVGRMFALTVLSTNRRRLLDGIRRRP